MNDPHVRTGQGSTKLSRQEFERRYRAQFYDPAFDAASAEIERLTAIAWEAYDDNRKSPRARKAGAEFSDLNIVFRVGPAFQASVSKVAGRPFSLRFYI